MCSGFHTVRACFLNHARPQGHPCVATRNPADNGCPMCRQQKASCGQWLSHVSPAESFLRTMAVPCVASRKLLADNGCPMCRQQKASCGQWLSHVSPAESFLRTLAVPCVASRNPADKRLSHVSPAGSFLWTMILPLHNLLVDMQWLSPRGAPYIQWLSPSEAPSGRLY